MTHARDRLLGALHDHLSNYLVDECPDSIAWEDFDPDIDAIRTSVADLMEPSDEAGPIWRSPLTIYGVTVYFASDGDRYASEDYRIAASSPERARHRALSLALDSVYNHPEVPGLTFQADITEAKDPVVQPCSGLVIRAPECFADPDFQTWLQNGDPKFTWYRAGPVDEWSDVVVLVDPSLNGEGSDADMPAHIWQFIIQRCRQHIEPGQHRCHIMVRLTNLAA